MRHLDEFSYTTIFLKSLFFSIASILLSYYLFRGETSLISVFFTSISLLWTGHLLFERDKREIWEKIKTPFEANKKLSISLLFIFFGVMLGYGIFVIFADISTTRELLSKQLGIYQGIKVSIKDIDFSSFKTIFSNNIAVLFIVLFISLIYRLGGVILVICWNASIWGTVFLYIIKTGTASLNMNPVYYFFATTLCIFPHLFTEASGYVLCSISGFFISKGITKYEFQSDRFMQVVKSASIIFIISLILIFISAFLESGLAPKLISFFFK